MNLYNLLTFLRTSQNFPSYLQNFHSLPVFDKHLSRPAANFQNIPEFSTTSSFDWCRRGVKVCWCVTCLFCNLNFDFCLAYFFGNFTSGGCWREIALIKCDWRDFISNLIVFLLWRSSDVAVIVIVGSYIAGGFMSVRMHNNYYSDRELRCPVMSGATSVAVWGSCRTRVFADLGHNYRN